jgi:hypothetical protein
LGELSDAIIFTYVMFLKTPVVELLLTNVTSFSTPIFFLQSHACGLRPS